MTEQVKLKEQYKGKAGSVVASKVNERVSIVLLSIGQPIVHRDDSTGRHQNTVFHMCVCRTCDSLGDTEVQTRRAAMPVNVFRLTA